VSHFLRPVLFFIGCLLALCTSPLLAQQLIATVPVGYHPGPLAVNPATNKIYVNNQGAASITVIDGVTNQTTTINLGFNTSFGTIAVNTITNKIYLVSGDNIAVIDGATNIFVVLPDNDGAQGVAVNEATNQIYVVNGADSVTIVDGATNNQTTISAGRGGPYIAINPVTNKIYVANEITNTLTVIDGNTKTSATVTIGDEPHGVAVNSVTNKIYTANSLDDTVSIVDGDTNQTQTITVHGFPFSIATNSAANQIYTANEANGTTTIIDGVTNQTLSINTGSGPDVVVVDAVTDNIYVNDPEVGPGNLDIIDGVTHEVTSVPVGRIPYAIAINPASNRVYVVNQDDNTVSVVGGATRFVPLQFVPVTPCRLIDTRLSGGSLPANTSRNFAVPQLGGCGIPSTAAAYSLNVTAVPQGRLGFLTIWATGQDQPVVSTMNSLDGRIKANAAIVPAGYQGQVSVFVNDSSDVVLDIDGYFTAPGSSTLAFYPLAPCRIVDTRNTNGDLGGPFLNQDQQRDFPVLESTCIPPHANAQAYSFNVTAVPHPTGQRLGFLTVWPKGETQPGVSTLNNVTGTIVANAAIVPSGTGGAISVYPNNNTDLLIDINGYFAAPGTNGLSLYTVAPCRVIDTRQVGNGQPFMNELTVNVMGSQCALPSNAQAYVFNATIVPPGQLGFLTLWADGQTQPNASTLNAKDGAITSNMAVVPTTNGSIDAYANDLTQLILDISSYFAP
jgi:YVTN family beta-propeller protein